MNRTLSNADVDRLTSTIQERMDLSDDDMTRVLGYFIKESERIDHVAGQLSRKYRIDFDKAHSVTVATTPVKPLEEVILLNVRSKTLSIEEVKQNLDEIVSKLKLNIAGGGQLKLLLVGNNENVKDRFESLDPMYFETLFFNQSDSSSLLEYVKKDRADILLITTNSRSVSKLVREIERRDPFLLVVPFNKFDAVNFLELADIHEFIFNCVIRSRVNTYWKTKQFHNFSTVNADEIKYGTFSELLNRFHDETQSFDSFLDNIKITIGKQAYELGVISSIDHHESLLPLLRDKITKTIPEFSQKILVDYGDLRSVYTDGYGKIGRIKVADLGDEIGRSHIIEGVETFHVEPLKL